jgi:hypothetical protein
VKKVLLQLRKKGEIKMDKKMKKTVYVGVVVLVVMGLFGAYFFKSAQAYGDGLCQDYPDSFVRIEQRRGVSVIGENIFIARAVVSTGEGVSSSSVNLLTFKPCWSEDPSLENVTNMFVTLEDGTFVTIITGVIGKEVLPLE